MKYRVVSNSYEKKYSIVHEEHTTVSVTDAICTHEATAERICDFLNQRATVVAQGFTKPE